jgi:hypothetical protein
MGNWHCITSSCATVHYREYSPPKTRWRYGAEPWKEIEGDDYTIKQEFDTNNRQTYTYQLIANAYLAQAYQNEPAGTLIEIYDNGSDLGILNNFSGAYRGQSNNTFIDYDYTYWSNGYCERRRKSTFLNYKGHQVRLYSTNGSDLYIYNIHNIRGKYLGLASGIRCNFYSKNNYDFIVYKNQHIVYQESRSQPPEVQKIPCQLSTIEKQIEIRKIPYLDRVEVVDYAYDVRLGLLVDSSNYGFLVAKEPIPSQCLNIYNNSITSTIPTNVANTPENLYLQIAQICSAPGCPPPEYQVICDCNNCESCPDGTCAVECEGQICCYGSNGVSVKSIALENYCGGQS